MAAIKEKAIVLDADKLAAIDHTKPESIGDFMFDMGKQMTSATVWANMTRGVYQHGAFHKNANSDPDTDILFERYHDGRKAPGGAGPLSKTSAPTYRSVIASVANAGRKLPYDGETVMEFIASLGSVAFSSRGGIINRIVEDFPTTKPTIDALEKHFADNTPDNVTDKAVKALASVENWGTDDSPDTRDTIISNEKLKASYKAMRQALRDFVEISATVLPRSPDKRTKGKKAPSAAAASLA